MLNQSETKLFVRKGTMYCGIGDFMSNLKDKGKAETEIVCPKEKIAKQSSARVSLAETAMIPG